MGKSGSNKLYISGSETLDLIEGSFAAGSEYVNINGNLEVLTGYVFKHAGASGWSGSFTNGDGDTVTVSGGIITGVA